MDRNELDNDFDSGDFEGFEEFDEEFTEVETLVMTDDDGAETVFLVIDKVEFNGSVYLLIVEEEKAEDDEADAVLIKQKNGADGECSYEDLADDEFEEVAKILSKQSGEYDIEY
jgi:uncharacterized protein YrzB (UPF0473 family)